MMESKSSVKVALVYPNKSLYSRNAVVGFLAEIKDRAPQCLNYEIQPYYTEVFDRDFTKQVAQSVCSDKPDIIVVMGLIATLAIMRALREQNLTIPTVFVGVSKPVEYGIMQSSTSSGNNCTGFATNIEDESLPFELFHYLQPHIKRVLLPYGGTVVFNEADSRAEDAKKQYAKYGVEVELLPIDSIDGVSDKLRELKSSAEAVGNILRKIEGMISSYDAVICLEADVLQYAYAGIGELCERYKKLFISMDIQAIIKGAALVYGVDSRVIGRAAVNSVIQILEHGVAPSDIPFTLVNDSRRVMINAEEAKEQGAVFDEKLMKLLKRVSMNQLELGYEQSKI